MKTSVFFSGILSLLLLISSCQKDSIDTSSWLKIDADEVIQLESGTSERIIAVNSSQGQWAATSNADWLEAKHAGDYLVINAKSNETLNVRKAQILVVSSGIKRTLQIEQAGYPTLVVETDPAMVAFGEEEGQMRLIIKSNATDWVVQQPSEEWIKVVARPRVAELVVKVKANETTNARTADIIVSAGGQNTTIKVKQDGQLNFYLPFSDWGMSFDNIQKRELARKSKLAGIPNPDVGDRGYTFLSVSKSFQFITYEFENYGTDKLQATTLIGDRNIPYTNEYHDFLVSQGFERITPMDGRTKGILVYIHKEKKIDMSIYAIHDKDLQKDVSVIFCRPIVEQPAPMPTLTDLETGILRFGEATVQDVEAWENAHGGKYDEEFSKLYRLPLFFVDDPFYARGYFFDNISKSPDPEKLVVSGYLYLYTDYKLGVYRHGGMEYLTNEFKDLLKREGFEFMYFYPNNRGYYFKNTNKEVIIIVRTIVMGARRLMRINYIPMPKTTNASLRSAVPSESENNNKISTNITNVEL